METENTNCRYVAGTLHNELGLSSKSHSCAFVHRRSPIIGTSRVSRTITAIRQIVFRTSFGRCQTPRQSYTRARAAPSHCNFVSRELHNTIVPFPRTLRRRTRTKRKRVLVQYAANEQPRRSSSVRRGGVRRVSTALVADEIEFLGKKKKRF